VANQIQFFSTNLVIHFIANREAIIVTANPAKFSVENNKSVPASFSAKIIAPRIVGIARKKEILTEFWRLSPIKIRKATVIPEREIPGKTAMDWIIPRSAAVFQVKDFSVEFGLI
jgi:hypothetical protein